jgi:hypothetical protein
MTVLCAERALLATARNRRFLELGVIRAAVRTTIVFLFAGVMGLRVFPVAFALSEFTYLISVLLQFRVERSSTRQLQRPVAVAESVPR